VLALERCAITQRVAAATADPKSAILLAVGGLLHREIAIEELLRRLVDGIAAAMGADRGTIYLVDYAKGEVYSRAAHLPELDEIRLRLGQGVAGIVAQTGDVVNLPTTRRDERFYQGVDDQTGYRTESMLAVPLRDRTGRILGVVQLLNKRGGPFGRQDEQALGELAAQAAVAIEATTLYAELSRGPESEGDRLPLSGQFNRIVGESVLLQDACRLTKKAAASDATVLIRGESGTGKELFARAVHVNSRRAEGPFVKVDCAALPESLIENELFGHERGAFTGADRKAPGQFDAARGGTLFLDEIGELPLSVQGKLLRVLQDREFLPLGAVRPIQADVRIVAATNRDLEKLCSAGRFRPDLYFRIKVVQLVLPPLRQRGPRDIARLAAHFATLAARRYRRPVPSLSPAATARLVAHGWPGNVRELEHCIESAVVTMEGTCIGPEDLALADRAPSSVASTPPDAAASSRGRAAASGLAEGITALAEVERAHILAMLRRAGGNRTEAARLLGIGRNTLARKLKSYGL
jgi:Nif-specific regulatory protein